MIPFSKRSVISLSLSAGFSEVSTIGITGRGSCAAAGGTDCCGGAAASISTFAGSGRSGCGKLITLYSFGMSFSCPLYHSEKVFLLL